MIMEYLYNKTTTIFVLIYIFILFTYDFEDKIPYLIFITLLLIFFIYKNGNKRVIETMDNIDNQDNVDNVDNEELADENIIDNLSERIKILEEMVSLKEWSSAQSHEITRLRSKLDDINDKEDETTTTPTLAPFEPKLEDTPKISKKYPIKPMGMFDSICFDDMVKDKKYNLIDEKQLDTYLGSTLPLESTKTEGGLDGPSIDGSEKTPKKMSMFGNNQSSISCCDKSPYFTSTGCICITDEQEKFIGSRGGNHELPEKSQCLV
jgi:hypothetical protein